MKKVLLAALLALSVSACVAGGGAPANEGTPLTSAESVFAGTWSGNLPSGKPVRIVVTPAGGVSYYFETRAQSLKNVKISSARLSATVGTNNSTITLAPSGQYVFTWGPTGQETRATLSKG